MRGAWTGANHVNSNSPVDEQIEFDPDNNTGHAFSNGAPGTELWEETQWDFGNTILVDAYESPNNEKLQSVTMHEIGHVLGAGWADDTPIPVFGFVVENGYEVYSGDVDGDIFEPDETPERVNINGRSEYEWSIMTRGTAIDFGDSSSNTPMLTYSIEELSTIDFEKIPSRDDT